MKHIEEYQMIHLIEGGDLYLNSATPGASDKQNAQQFEEDKEVVIGHLKGALDDKHIIGFYHKKEQ